MADADLCHCAGKRILRAIQAGFLRRGEGGGISSVPWCPGNLCQASLALLNFSEIRSFRCAIDITTECPGFAAAFPARTSAFSLPGVPSWPLTQTRLTVRRCCWRSQTMFRILRATACPGPAPYAPLTGRPRILLPINPMSSARSDLPQSSSASGVLCSAFTSLSSSASGVLGSAFTSPFLLWIRFLVHYSYLHLLPMDPVSSTLLPPSLSTPFIVPPPTCQLCSQDHELRSCSVVID
jgi:hypothetical protein